MPIVQKPGSPFLWYDFRIAGVRYRGSTKQTSKQKAQQVEAALITQISLGQRSGVRAKAPLLQEFASVFLRETNASRLASATKAYYRNGWKLLAGQDVSKMRLDAITGRVADTIKSPGSGSNLNMALRTLSAILSSAVEHNLITARPRIRMAAENRRHRLISELEEAMILSKAGLSLHDVFLLVFDTGMRPSEATGLAWEHVDFVRGAILVVKGKTKSARRYLSMTTRVMEMMKDRAQLAGAWVFPSPIRAGEHIHARCISTAFTQLKVKLGLPNDLVLYSARHTFGTDFMNLSRDLVKTSRTMGHANVGITQRYLHPEAADVGTLMDTRNVNRGHNLGHTNGTVQ
jgi:integrase